ncbi:unnamed protein product, partial [Trichobilharzia regenti]
MKGSQRGGYQECPMVSSNAYRLSECNRFRATSSTDKLQAARQTRLCFTHLQEVHTKMNCESVRKFSDKLNVKSRSDSELCDDNGVVKKSVVATASDPPLSSSTGINQSSLVLSSTLKMAPMNSSILRNDYDSTDAFEKTKRIAQFSEDKPSVYER